MDDQLKSRFEQVLQRYADVLRERDDALLREKKAREQFEAPSAPPWIMSFSLQSPR